MSLAAVTAGFVLASCVAGLAAPELIVKLSIPEEAGRARVQEPITMGVPLPEGKVTDVRRLALADAEGKPIECQFTEVARWLGAESVKWVHATWMQSLAAGATGEVAVMLLDETRTAPQGSLSAVTDGETVTVQTGFVKFTVRGAGFDGVSAAWFDATGANKFDDANQVVKPKFQPFEALFFA